MILSALAAARKDSKFLAKFLHNYQAKTIEDGSTELLMMMSAQDTWNDEIVAHFMARGVKFFEEDKGLGRNGLHLYYEMMLPHAQGDWIVYFCEDHNIVKYGWNKIIQHEIKILELNPDEPYILTPKWDNTGSMNHVVSKGFIKALGGHIAGHGNLDSYINHLGEMIPSSHVLWLPELFHDFTHDGDVMSHENSKVEISEEGKALPTWGQPEVTAALQRDADILNSILIR